jgi:predicted nucleic acid-binding protein
LLVVDASLVVELSLDRIGEQARDALGEDQLIAPALLWSEVPSVINELSYRNEITRELADQAFDRFINGKVGIVEDRPEGLARTAWRLARELGWAKTYDAEYIALAQIVRCRLVTLDMRLRRGADRLGIVVTPDELL